MLKLKKKKTWIFLFIAIIGVLAIVFMLLICTHKNKKAGNEIAEIFKYNEYETYYMYGYGQNIYDKDGNCYSYSHEKKACSRETVFLKFLYFEILDSNNPNYHISMFLNLDDNYNITKKQLLYEYHEKDDDTFSKYQYVTNDDKTESYFIYRDDENTCYDIRKTKTLNKDNIELCTKTPISELKAFENTYQKELKSLKITEADLYTYIEWYYEQYAKPQLLKTIETLENETLSYQEIQSYIEAKEYEIEKRENNVVISDFLTVGGTIYSYTIFNVMFENDKPSMLAFTDSLYENRNLYYDIEYNVYYGSNSDNTSFCLMNLGEKTLNEISLQEKNCTDDIKKDLEGLLYQLNSKLRDIGILQNEMLEFAQAYYQQN